MLSPLQSMIGMIKRYYKKPKTIEFYFNFIGFTTFFAFTGYLFFDKDFISNITSSSSTSSTSSSSLSSKPSNSSSINEIKINKEK